MENSILYRQIQMHMHIKKHIQTIHYRIVFYSPYFPVAKFHCKHRTKTYIDRFI